MGDADWVGVAPGLATTPYLTVYAAFQTSFMRLGEGILLRLCGAPLLRGGLLTGGRVLLAALPTCGNRTHRCASARIAANDFTHNRTAHAGTGGRARCGCCWLGRGCRRRWLGGVEAALLDGSGIAGRLVTLLLLWTLPLGGVNKLLRARLANKCRR